MITARLNTLIQAYRRSKALIGDANRGIALPGPAFRMCHKVRRAVWAEIQRVRNLLTKSRNKAQKHQEKPMAFTRELNGSGESAQAISRRQDDDAMKTIISALQDGAHLRIHTKVRRAAIEGLPSKDIRNGRTISANRCKRLEREGVLQEVALDRYAMHPDFELGELG